jgi:membrane-associated phospholipid phosphatase
MRLRALLRTTRDRLPWWSRHLLALGGVFVLLGVFLLLTREVFGSSTLESVDRAILHWVAAQRSPTLTQGAIDITSLGSPTLFWLFTACALGVLAAARDLRGALQLLLAAAGNEVLTEALKAFLGRPRPGLAPLVTAHGYSYPSGHTMAAAALYVTLALVGARHFKVPAFRRVLLVLAALAMTLVACSRVYLGVHHPTDVVSGAAVGAGWALLLASAFAYWEESHRRRGEGSG